MFGLKLARIALIPGLAVLILVFATNLGIAGASSGGANPTSCKPAVDFNRGNFSNPTRIDNQWLPLAPGMQLTLQGTVNGGTTPTPHDVVFTVTDLTKVIDGVRTVVLWDQDINEGVLSESELAFFAQDNSGNVWNLGEYPEEYDSGTFTGAPYTWISGIAGAHGGIHMFAKPRVGTPDYLQGIAPRISFLDCAQVFETGQTVSVPFNTYQNVLVTNEWSPLVTNSGTQQKYYASGIGNVQIGASGDPEAETLSLVNLVRLNADAMERVNGQALKLDRHGYQVSAVYRQTAPAR
jgi:hypothetical protein